MQRERESAGATVVAGSLLYLGSNSLIFGVVGLQFGADATISSVGDF